MSVRFTPEFAAEKGWITEKDAKVMRQRSTSGKRSPARRRAGSSSGGPAHESPPQEKLWNACLLKWPTWEGTGELCAEYVGAVPNRRFRLDIAFPRYRLAVEVDGWVYHGKYLEDFKRDRQRDRLLTLEGWRVLRYFAEEIHSDPAKLVDEIEQVIEVIEVIGRWRECSDNK